MPPIYSSLMLSTISVVPSLFSFSVSMMVPDLEKPRVTEIQVRMDCNGCVQKIKKALHGVSGIYDLYIDLPQQKLTIIGSADPEKIVKAIRKTRKIATICSHTEQSDQPAEAPQQPPEGGEPPPAAEAANPPPPEAQPAEVANPPPAEPPKDPPPPENPPLEEKPSPSPVAAEVNRYQPAQAPGPKDVGEVHVIYHHPPDYGYRYGYGHSYDGQWSRYPNVHGFPPDPRYPINQGPPPEPRHPANQGPPPEPRHPANQGPPPEPRHPANQGPPPEPRHQVNYEPPPEPRYADNHGPPPEPRYPINHGPPPEPRYPNGHGFPPQPIYATHSYNTYRPSPYVTEYEYVRSPPHHTIYSRMDHYNEDYHENTRNGNITSIFSDENPNACTIV